MNPNEIKLSTIHPIPGDVILIHFPADENDSGVMKYSVNECQEIFTMVCKSFPQNQVLGMIPGINLTLHKKG